MLTHGFGSYDKVVQVQQYSGTNEAGHSYGHKTAECDWRVTEPKWHPSKMEMTRRGRERCDRT